MQAGDILIDGGNSYFKDDVRRSAKLKEKGIHYVDVGTSGGVWGLERGYCMMIGGPKEVCSNWIRSSKRWLPGAATFRARPDARRCRAPPKTATSTAALRRRPLRQNGAQRNRIRTDASLRRRLRHLPQRDQQRSAGRTSLRPESAPTSPKSGGAAAW